MAAETLCAQGFRVDVYDAMPSPGRKFLLAGKGGLNLTHSEPLEPFLERYGPARARLEPWICDFGPVALRAWADALGAETFVGSSGRVFPREMKAAPLLRAWLRRLRAAGMQLHTRHRWVGWAGVDWVFETPAGRVVVAGAPCVLALGGASWPRLGSDGAWVPLLRSRGLEVRDLEPSNCGFEVDWSAPFRERFAGAPVKSVALTFGGLRREGELVVTEHGLEGSLLYPFSPALRRAVPTTVELDLLPHRSQERVERELAQPRGKRSLSEHLRRRLGLEGVKAGLLRELGSPANLKTLPVKLLRPRPLAEAISTAGGVGFEASLPGIFFAGEMLDWEAPTGGYLLTACFASGRAAGLAAAAWGRANSESPETR